MLRSRYRAKASGGGEEQGLGATIFMSIETQPETPGEVAALVRELGAIGFGESKRLVVESPWSHFTSECQRFDAHCDSISSRFDCRRGRPLGQRDGQVAHEVSGWGEWCDHRHASRILRPWPPPSRTHTPSPSNGLFEKRLSHCVGAGGDNGIVHDKN
jgi:hypothetical protein